MRSFYYLSLMVLVERNKNGLTTYPASDGEGDKSPNPPAGFIALQSGHPTGGLQQGVWSSFRKSRGVLGFVVVGVYCLMLV